MGSSKFLGKELRSISSEDGSSYEVISKMDISKDYYGYYDSPDAISTFLHLLEDQNAISILTNHYSTLSVSERVNFPVLCSVRRKSKNTDSPFKHLSPTDKLKAEHKMDRIIELAKPKAESLLMSFITQYPDKSRDLISNISSEDGDTPFDLEASFDLLFEMVSNPEDSFEEKVIKFIRTFEEFFIDEVAPVVSMMTNSGKEEFYSFCCKHQQSILNNSNLTPSRYNNTIEELETDYRIITPFLSLYWCDNKKHEDISFFTFTPRVRPTIQCASCETTMNDVTLYCFKPDICYHIRRSEGLIIAIIHSLFRKSKIKWSPNVYLSGNKDDSEKDIVYRKDNGYGIVEIKSYARDGTKRTRKENMKKIVNQLLRDFKEYTRKGIVITEMIGIVNYHLDKDNSAIIKDLLKQSKYHQLKNITHILGCNSLDKMGKLLGL